MGGEFFVNDVSCLLRRVCWFATKGRLTVRVRLSCQGKHLGYEILRALRLAVLGAFRHDSEQLVCFIVPRTLFRIYYKVLVVCTDSRTPVLSLLATGPSPLLRFDDCPDFSGV